MPVQGQPRLHNEITVSSTLPNWHQQKNVVLAFWAAVDTWGLGSSLHCSSEKQGHLGNPLDFVCVRNAGTALFVPLETNVAQV